LSSVWVICSLIAGLGAEIAHVALGEMVTIVSRCVTRRYNNQPLEVVAKP
jgi:hypothetical protein